jgi:hypothetical protein
VPGSNPPTPAQVPASRSLCRVSKRSTRRMIVWSRAAVTFDPTWKLARGGEVSYREDQSTGSREMSQICQRCEGTGSIRQSVKRAWWQRVLPGSESVDCPHCAGTGIEGIEPWQAEERTRPKASPAPPQPQRSWTPKDLAKTLDQSSSQLRYDTEELVRQATLQIEAAGVSLYAKVFYELGPVYVFAKERMATIAKSIGDPALTMLLDVLRTSEPRGNSPWFNAGEILAEAHEPRAIPLLTRVLPPSCTDQRIVFDHIIALIGKIGSPESIEVLVTQARIATETVNANPSGKHAQALRILEKVRESLKINLKQHITKLSPEVLKEVAGMADVGSVTGSFVDGEGEWNKTESFDFSELRMMAERELGTR